MARHSVHTLVAGIAALLPSLAAAQVWSVQSGVAARVEYNDNYFFAPDNPQSAFTASITPFVTAARRTETTDVTALLAVGANKVWGPTPTTDYLSGRFGLDASLREARSTWTGNASFVRSPTLQTDLGQAGVVLGLAYTNAASASGAYTYALTERWSLGAIASGYNNQYDGIDSNSTFSNNHGYYVGGNVGYAYSERTQFTLSAGYSYYSSNLSRSDSVTATLGVAHQLSPELTISASVGGFWSDTEPAQGVSIATSDQRRATGGLYGGSLSWAISERTQLGVSLLENLAPSGAGLLSKSDNAGVTLSHKFSERLTGRFGASYVRTIFPQALNSSFNNDYFQSEVGVSYLIAERWTLDAGYRYARAQYSQNPFEPKSNIGFVSIAYNWPGTSFTGWVGRLPDTQNLPGAGPLTLPAMRGAPPASPEGSPFDQFTLP